MQWSWQRRIQICQTISRLVWCKFTSLRGPLEASQVTRYKRKYLHNIHRFFWLANASLTLPLFLQGIWTRLGADLNLSQVVLELYPMKDVVEVYFLDSNRTRFAQIHSNNGASLTNENSSVTGYWNRVTIERGSLIFPKINEADNHTTIILQALLNSKQTRLEAVSTKTMRIFVCNSSGKHGVINT